MGEKEIEGFSPLFTIRAMKYYMEYFKEKGFKDNLSYVAIENKQLLALVPILVLEDKEKKKNISLGGEFIKGPFFNKNISFKMRKKFCKDYLDTMSNIFSQNGISYLKTMPGPSHFMAGHLYHHPFYKPENEHQTLTYNIIDLRKEKEEIWLSVRNGYRSLINKTKSICKVKIIDKNQFDESDCEQYRKLHAHASGKSTRSIETFKMMYSMIKHGYAFLILIENEEKTLASTLCFTSGTVARYASSAQLNSIPNTIGAGHLALWSAIEYCYQNKIMFFNTSICEKDFKTSDDEKINSINFFKRGYGGVDISLIGSIVKNNNNIL